MAASIVQTKRNETKQGGGHHGRRAGVSAPTFLTPFPIREVRTPFSNRFPNPSHGTPTTDNFGWTRPNKATPLDHPHKAHRGSHAPKPGGPLTDPSRNPFSKHFPNRCPNPSDEQPTTDTFGSTRPNTATPLEHPIHIERLNGPQKTKQHGQARR